MNSKKKIQVCFSSDQFLNFADGCSTVVVVDLLRATSVISTAFECGIDSIIPVRSLDEVLKYRNKKNHIIAAERNTHKLDGFDYGNSPFHYLESNIEGKVLALTTTNGTKAIHVARGHHIITASFINITAVVNYLIEQNSNVIILCSGWKGVFSLEDTIYAGALAKKLLNSNNYESNCDSLQASIKLFELGKEDLFSFLDISAYRKRNRSTSIIRDTRFCLNPKISSDIVPVFQNGRLVRSL